MGEEDEKKKRSAAFIDTGESRTNTVSVHVNDLHASPSLGLEEVSGARQENQQVISSADTRLSPTRLNRPTVLPEASAPILEARLVVEEPPQPIYDAVAVPPRSTWKRYPKYIFVVLGLLLGAAIVLGAKLGSNNSTPPSTPTAKPTVQPTVKPALKPTAPGSGYCNW